MNRIDLNRRDFTKLTVAAFGGIVAGTTIGCGGGDGDGTGDGGGTGDGTGTGDGPEGSGTTDDSTSTDGDGGGDVVASVDNLLEGKHVCRGLNACKMQGKSGQNDCAGTSACYTAGKSGCHYENDCKGQGGCEDTAGTNGCEKKGNCAVPLGKDTWTKVRAKLKEALAKKDTMLGNAEIDGPPDA
jgi:hypothetical protein